jgi:hypothetical protein
VVRVALAVGLALLVAAIAVVLSRSPVTVAGTNSTPAYPATVSAPGGSSGCQPSGTLPQATSAIRVSIVANAGPRVTLKARSGSLVVAHGERDSGWGILENLSVPVNQVPRTIPNAEVCLAFGPAVVPVPINGAKVQVPVAGGGTRTATRFRVEYVRTRPRSWWSLAPTVARHIGLARAPSGTWIVYLVIAIMVAITALASRLVLQELR